MTETVAKDAPVERWTKVIVPRRGALEIPWRELWRYRDLIWLLARRNFATQYKQTVLGQFWYVLQPFIVTAVFSYLFGRMADLGTDRVPHFLFYMGGLVIWNFFSDTVQRITRIFMDFESLFAKVYFPRLAAPLAVVLTNLVPLVVQFGLFACGLVFYLAKQSPWIHPTWWMLCTPLIFLEVGMLAFGLGCIVAALTKRFRDLVVGVQLGLQLLMFASAIVFPISRIAPENRWIFFLNPIVTMVESFRFAWVGVSLIQPWHVVLCAGVTLLVFITGLILFNRAEQDSMDTI